MNIRSSRSSQQEECHTFADIGQQAWYRDTTSMHGLALFQRNPKDLSLYTRVGRNSKLLLGKCSEEGQDGLIGREGYGHSFLGLPLDNPNGLFVKGKTITWAYYIDIFNHFDEDLKRKRPHLSKKNIFFHHDNARALRIAATPITLSRPGPLPAIWHEKKASRKELEVKYRINSRDWRLNK